MQSNTIPPKVTSNIVSFKDRYAPTAPFGSQLYKDSAAQRIAAAQGFFRVPSFLTARSA